MIHHEIYCGFLFVSVSSDQWIVGTTGNQGFDGKRSDQDCFCSSQPADLHKSHQHLILEENILFMDAVLVSNFPC